ncbi:MAG: extracellular solute-binding protein [Gammaproteobacteria bacterium]
MGFGIAIAFTSAPSALAAGKGTLTLYSGQHQQMVRLLVSAFEKESGITVKMRSGESPELASAIIREDKGTRADVFFAENSPELQHLQAKGLLAPVARSTLGQIPARYSSTKGLWVGVLARQNVLTYNPKVIGGSALPASILDLAKPEWKGKIAIAPTDSDFLPLVRAVADVAGRHQALAWLKGLKRNAQIYQDDEGVATAVNRGSVSVGIINNYYWYRMREQVGKKHIASKIYHFKSGDVGNLINISGAAVLKYAPHPKLAQEFLAFIVSKSAQTLLAQSTIDFEYPLRPDVPANSQLKPFNQLQPPKITVTELGTDREALQLLQEAGLL